MPARRTIILSFDMETDLGSWGATTRGISEGTGAILKVLARRGVPATFFWVGREAEELPEAVRAACAGGHEIGCHTMYHETVGQPVYRVPVGGFMLDHEIEARLALATEAVARVCGTRPVSFRAPRLFGSAAMIRALDRLGYLVDSSLPAYAHGRRGQPYHPHPDDWTRTGSLRILELPPFYDMDVADDGGLNRDRDQWPMMRLRGADWFADLTRRMAARISPSEEAVMVVYLHPWEYVPMPRTLRCDECSITFDPFIWEGTGDQAVQGLDRYIAAMQDDGFAFTTMRAYATRAGA
jgi:peptidoglycan-N-acetylglucosamine deacetylase